MNIEVNRITDVKTVIGNLQVIYLEGANVPDGKYFVAKSLIKSLGYANVEKAPKGIPIKFKTSISNIKTGTSEVPVFDFKNLPKKHCAFEVFFID